MSREATVCAFAVSDMEEVHAEAFASFTLHLRFVFTCSRRIRHECVLSQMRTEYIRPLVS